jgi:hypothetical protein
MGCTPPRFCRSVRCVEIGNGQGAAPGRGSLNDPFPGAIGDPIASQPSINRVLLLIQGGRQPLMALPDRKYVVKRLHSDTYIPDYLSVQGRTEKQVTSLFPQLNIEGMKGIRKASTPATWRKEFISRVKAARLASNKKPVEVAAELVVSLDTYNRWETRALLPHHLIVPFCRITGADPMELMTGVPFDLGRALSQQRR